jgi:uncharacterized damage-inducible protein DinB
MEQAGEEISRVLVSIPPEKLWERPKGAASVGFHVRHAVEAVDRLLTYAEGGVLNEAQLATLLVEKEPVADLANLVQARLNEARERVARLVFDGEVRFVGRAKIQVPLETLLAHIAEHTQRHLGQIATTAKLV